MTAARTRSPRRAGVVLIALLALLLTACSSGSEYLGSAEWTVRPEMGGAQQGPPAPPPTPPQDQQASPVRATGLDQPTAIATLPDGSALVGERTTGQISRVFADPGVPRAPLFVIPGIDPAGDGGLLGLVASAKYYENGLIYAFVTTATDSRVLSVSNVGGVVEIVTGIPRGATRNGGALTVLPDGTILIATGDTGNPALVNQAGSLAGKVLHVNQFGEPVAGSSIVAASGTGNPSGICTDGTNVYVVDAGEGPAGGMAGNGVYKVGGDGTFTVQSPLISYADDMKGAAGCTTTGVELIVTGLDSQSLMTSTLDGEGNPVSDPLLTLTGQFGRLRAIALDPVNGYMWVATYNRDGYGQPVAEDDRVLLLPPPQSAGGDSGGIG